MSERKEIVLPYDLYHRIRISSEEHGGVGRGVLFDRGMDNPGMREEAGEPLCAHGHAWGTCTNYNNQTRLYEHPELRRYLRTWDNDDTLEAAGVEVRERIPFARWCELLNVKCGPKQGEGVEKPRQALGTLGRVATPEPAGVS